MSNVTHKILVRTAFVAALVAVSGAAGAAPIKPPVGSANPGTPAALHFDAKTCNADDRAAITEAFTIAQERVAAGLEVIAHNGNDPHIARWFGTAPRAQVATVLQSVLRKLESAGSFTIACNTDYCAQRQPYAYTVESDALVGFCETFFRAGLTGEDSRVGTVVHELSHLAAHTQDHAYGRRNAAALATKTPDRAADNADNFEYFIETLAE
jgi:peptidyl-Lys metalloendopeptidase